MGESRARSQEDTTRAAPRVGIVLGSDSDLPQMEGALDVLERFGVAYEITVASAHRTPERAARLAREAWGRGVRVLIAAAGGAAHLAGVLASHTLLPVIGVPLASTPLHGLDALLATVQMPAGVPVATVALDEAGARNAALLAAEILALSEPALGERLRRWRADLASKVRSKDDEVRRRYPS